MVKALSVMDCVTMKKVNLGGVDTGHNNSVGFSFFKMCSNNVF